MYQCSTERRTRSDVHTSMPSHSVSRSLRFLRHALISFSVDGCSYERPLPRVYTVRADGRLFRLPALPGESCRRCRQTHPRLRRLRGGPAAVDLIRVLEEIQMFEKRLEEVKVWEATVKELEEALQVRRGAELSGVR